VASGPRPFDDVEPAIEMLDQGRAAFHPIAVVAVQDAAEVADLAW